MNFDFPSLLELLPNTMYGQWVKMLFSPDGGTPLNSVLSILNMGFFFFAVYYAGFQFGLYPLAIMRTKKVDAGKGLSWGLVRSGIVFALLIPDPRSGLSMINHVTIAVGSAGNNLAQLAWNQTRKDFFDPDGTIFTNVLPDPGPAAAKLFEFHVCNYYSRLDRGLTNFRAGVVYEPVNMKQVVGQQVFSAASTQWSLSKQQHGACGIMKLPEFSQYATGQLASVTALTKNYSSRLANEYVRLSNRMAILAAKFAFAYHPRTQGKKGSLAFDIDGFYSQYDKELTAFIKRRAALYESFVRQLRKARKVEADNIFEEWLQAGGTWQRISNIGNFQNSVVTNSKPSFVSPQWSRIWSQPPHHVNATRSRMSALFVKDDPDMVNQLTGPQGGSMAINTNPGYIEEKIVRKAKEKLSKWVIGDFDYTNPIGSLVSKGYTYLGMYGAIISLVALLAVTLTPAVGMLAWELFSGARAALLFAGSLLVIVLPIVPFVLFLFGVVSWLLPIIFFFFLGPLWLIPNVRADSTVLIVGNGWTTLVDILFRPTILLAALGVAYVLVGVVAMLIDSTLGNALTFAYNSFTGLLVFALMACVYAVLMGIAAALCFLTIVILPNQITQYLPQESMTNG